MGTSINAGILARERVIGGDLLLGTVVFNVGAGKFLGFLGVFLGLVEFGLELQDGRSTNSFNGFMLLRHN